VLNDDKTLEQMSLLMEQMKNYGFIQYEVSNFGKEGFFSQHNSNYWKGVEYLGFGPSAHSFINNKRFWNVSNNKKYINCIQSGKTYFEEEVINETKAFNEYILTNLRTSWGIDLEYVKGKFSESMTHHLNRELEPYLNSSYLDRTKEKITLTNQGVYIADKITSDLFLI
jgi:oxygen-independent coproporphyrinogen-3 oxidase